MSTSSSPRGTRLPSTTIRRWFTVGADEPGTRGQRQREVVIWSDAGEEARGKVERSHGGTWCADGALEATGAWSDIRKALKKAISATQRRAQRQGAALPAAGVRISLRERGGSPKERVAVALPADLLERIEAAQLPGESRADAIARLLLRGLALTEPRAPWAA